jgi:hypothetical protein
LRSSSRWPRPLRSPPLSGGFQSPSGRGTARLDRRQRAASGQEMVLTCADFEPLLLSLGRAGRIRTGDPLTPRTMRQAPPAKTATTAAETVSPPPMFRTFRRRFGDTGSQPGPGGPQLPRKRLTGSRAAQASWSFDRRCALGVAKRTRPRLQIASDRGSRSRWSLSGCAVRAFLWPWWRVGVPWLPG